MRYSTFVQHRFKKYLSSIFCVPGTRDTTLFKADDSSFRRFYSSTEKNDIIQMVNTGNSLFPLTLL